jgi:adenosylcobinamide-phosphate synthase
MDMDGIVILAAFIVDFIFGDPHWLPHPVRGIGWLVQRGESFLRNHARSPGAEKNAGIVLVVFVVATTYALTYLTVRLAFVLSPLLGVLVSILIAYTTIAARDLSRAARKVLAGLSSHDLIGARRDLQMIVGRDTEGLGEKEIARAVIETVAENTSDGVIAPIFYLAVGGPPLAMAYKAINTLDSMIGYKNKEYINFGRAAAKMDDVANFLPARIAAGLLCLASNISSLFASAFSRGKSTLSGPWKIMVRDGRNHPSPNSGYPEAAMAGALGVRLGGPSAYGGVVSRKPFLGDEGGSLDKKSIEKSLLFMYSASLLAVAASILGLAAVNW